MYFVIISCQHPLSCEVYPSLGWEPVAAVIIWGMGLTGNAADAVVPSLLWQCSSSSSAGSRQLSEIHGKIKKEQDVFPI